VSSAAGNGTGSPHRRFVHRGGPGTVHPLVYDVEFAEGEEDAVN
jgi:hypothetical protein